MRLGIVLASGLSAIPLFASSPSDESRLIEIAKSAVRAEVLRKSQDQVEKENSPRPVFVTIEVANKVIGCRGGLVARTTSLEEEVQLAARSAAAHDPRYRPLTAKDLQDFKVTVTLVERLEPLSRVSGLRPEDGLVLTAGGKSGIVLPWEGKDPQVRLEWAYRKAGVMKGAPVKLQRLIATRFRG
ncbi:MAG: AMMECR1 domain-containing protein [Armatimonadetes bacterium]|nr:AMMECR1 domain-containing protein [Armatimonadota bacterium]